MKKATIVKKQINSIEENIKRLEEGKRCAELRKEELFMLQNKLKEQLRECSIPEKKELINDSLENVQSCFTIMKKWITEIEDEIARVTAAGTSIATNDTEELRSAFKEYVLSDTAFSVKNITMALYDFDELIASAKKFVGKV